MSDFAEKDPEDNVGGEGDDNEPVVVCRSSVFHRSRSFTATGRRIYSHFYPSSSIRNC